MRGAVFLLASRLKYDRSIKIEEDNAGFIHSCELDICGNISLRIFPSIYRNLHTLTRFAKRINLTADKNFKLHKSAYDFLSKFLFEPNQLWHLLGNWGNIESNAEEQDKIWWLNVSSENITFSDCDNNIVQGKRLEKYLKELFPVDSYWSESERKRFYGKYIEGFLDDEETKKSHKTTFNSPLVRPNRKAQSGDRVFIPKYLREFNKELYPEGVKPEDAVWFRKSGPLGVDFKDNKVCTRKISLEELESLVDKNEFSILEGGPGSGKSVLVRQFAYNLIDKNKDYSIYHYSYKQDLDISDYHIFQEELNNVTGIVVIEDIHLSDIQKLQILLRDFSEKEGRHILFTARPSFRGSLRSDLSDKLEKLPALKLESKNDVDDIIEHYIKSTQNSAFKWTPEVKSSIKNISKNDLWMLSYALEGCCKSKGEGEAISWLEEGVKKDLENIEVLGGKPEILIALAPLYINENVTSQSFLIQKLRFGRSEIMNLIKQNEIIKHEIDNATYLGLPHSSLALAYWKYGKYYSDSLEFGKREEFIYQYATSGLSNSLRAVINSNINIAVPVLKRVIEEGSIDHIVDSESSLDAIIEWVCLGNKPIDINQLISEENYSVDILPLRVNGNIIKIISNKINACNDITQISRCLHAYFLLDNDAYDKKIWKNVNKDILSTKIQRSSCQDILQAFESFTCHHGTVAERFCNMLDIESYVNKLISEDKRKALEYISVIKFLNKRNRNQFMSSLSEDFLLSAINSISCIQEKCQGIENIIRLDREQGFKIWDKLNKKEIAKELEDGGPYCVFEDAINYDFVWSLSSLFSAKEQFGLDVWKYIDPSVIANDISMASIYVRLEFIIELYKLNKLAGEDVWNLLDHGKLQEEVLDCQEDEKRYIYTLIGEAALNGAKNALEFVNINELEAMLRNPLFCNLEDRCALISPYCKIDHNYARSICNIMKGSAHIDQMRKIVVEYYCCNKINDLVEQFSQYDNTIKHNSLSFEIPIMIKYKYDHVMDFANAIKSVDANLYKDIMHDALLMQENSNALSEFKINLLEDKEFFSDLPLDEKKELVKAIFQLEWCETYIALSRNT